MSRERPAAAGTSRPPAAWFAPAGTSTWPPTTSASWRCFPRRATRRGASSASCPESCRPIPRNASATSPMSRRSRSCPGPDAGACSALESGSKPNRRGGVLWDLDADGALTGDPRRLDLAALYAVLEADIPDLNIEGATVAGDRLLLFQRGNGRAGINAVIGLDLRERADRNRGTEVCSPAVADRHPPPRPRRGGRRARCASPMPPRSETPACCSRPSPKPATTPTATGCAPAPRSGCCAPDREARAGSGRSIRRRRSRASRSTDAGTELDLLMVADPDDPAHRAAPLLAARLLAVVRRRHEVKEAPDGASFGPRFLRPAHQGIEASDIAL